MLLYPTHATMLDITKHLTCSRAKTLLLMDADYQYTMSHTVNLYPQFTWRTTLTYTKVHVDSSFELGMTNT